MYDMSEERYVSVEIIN